MPHGAAVIGLTFNGTDLQEADFSVFLEIRSGLHDGLQVRGRDRTVPRLAGRIVLPRRGDRRVIELGGYISGVGSTAEAQGAAFRAIATEMEALFDLTMSPAALVATLEDGSLRTIDARPIEFVLGRWETPVLQVLEVDLESVDPNWVVSGS